MSEQSRAAIVRRDNGTPTQETVAGYLPSNYQVAMSTDEMVLIHGHDYAGWTLDGYVIPRMESGNIWPHEVFEPGVDHPLDIPVKCPTCGAGPGRQLMHYHGDTATGYLTCEVDGTTYVVSAGAHIWVPKLGMRVHFTDRSQDCVGIIVSMGGDQVDVQEPGLDGQPQGTVFSRYATTCWPVDATYCAWCGAWTSDGPDGNDLCNDCIDGQHPHKGDAS